jgi:hypothetical protein
MNHLMIRCLAAVVGVVALGCDRPADIPTPGLTMLQSPAADGARFPAIAADSTGRVVLTWAERDRDSVPAIRFSVRTSGGVWQRPETLVRDSALLVNFADFASVVPMDDGRLVGQWLRRPVGEHAPHAYELFLAQSVNDGGIWSAPVVPHGRVHPGEHGFASLLSMPGSATSVIFLNGSRSTASPRAMVLDHVIFDSAAKVLARTPVDDRVCDCCQTDAAMTSHGPVVVYRDRSPEEIRDITLARWSEVGGSQGQWSTTSVHADGWHIDGCPVNGPAVAGRGERVVVAWFTAARDTARVRLAFSSDAGATFDSPLDLATGPAALGRVDVVMLDDGSAVVTWLQRDSREVAEVRVAVVRPDRTVAWQGVAGRTDAGRSSGFPRMARAGGDVLLAWTETGTPSRVRIAAIAPR